MKGWAKLWATRIGLTTLAAGMWGGMVLEIGTIGQLEGCCRREAIGTALAAGFMGLILTLGAVAFWATKEWDG